jgi:hypothetical protein
MKSYQECSNTSSGQILDINGSGYLNFIRVQSQSSNANLEVTINIDGTDSVLSVSSINYAAGFQSDGTGADRGVSESLYMPYYIRFESDLTVTLSAGTSSTNSGIVISYTLD